MLDPAFERAMQITFATLPDYPRPAPKAAGIARVLPADVRAALVRASQIASPWERQRAIEAAIHDAKRRYPQYFKE